MEENSIAKIIEASIDKKMAEVEKCFKRDRRERSLQKLVKRRLYAYQQLKENIERYKLDIENIKVEDFGKSKSIVFRNGATTPQDIEDIRAAKIAIVEQKIARDEEEIKELDFALSTIRNEEYYPALEMTFFDEMKQDIIAEKLHCDKSTIWRQVGRLIDKLCIVLYGADAIAS